MTVLMVPRLEDEPYPTLGIGVAEWIEANLVFGPGDLRGEPARLDDEKRGLLYRIYELYPQGHPQAGRRRFRRVAISVRKGWAKTEFGAWIGAAELHPAAPVRCVGWDAHGQPIGAGVTDPYIPFMAVTEEQSEDLAFGALRVILGLSRVARDFNIGLDRILRGMGDGKAVPLATAPDARDGARTTFELMDETHRFTLPRHRMAHRVMLANLPKRKAADPWCLEITTAPAPGEGSVAESTMEYARQVDSGKVQDSRLFFFHRQASDKHDLSTVAGIRAAVLEASGPVAEWSDIDGIVEQWADPTADRAYLERVWLNRLVRASDHAFDAEKWRALARPEHVVEAGALVTLGFDGSRFNDATALMGCEVGTGHLFTLGIWERPLNVEHWEVPQDEVKRVLAEAMDRYDVWRLYADPPYWEDTVAGWAGLYGEERVMNWYTTRVRPMTSAVQSFNSAIQSAELSHDGNRQLAAHVGNACRRIVAVKDEKGEPLWTIYKERPDSPAKIDAAMAAVLAFEARRDAIASGATGERSIYESEGLLLV